MTNRSKPSPQSDEELAQAKSRSDQLRKIIRPLPDPRYLVDVGLTYIESQLEYFRKEYGLDLIPEFQRGHVWSQEQQIAFIEGMLRNTVKGSGLVIEFNAPSWRGSQAAGDLSEEIQVIDGLQRLTSVRLFMDGKLHPFGLSVSDLKGTEFNPARSIFGLKFAVHSFCWKKDLLQYYIDINSGGTPHSQEEILRVKKLMETCEKKESRNRIKNSN